MEGFWKWRWIFISRCTNWPCETIRRLSCRNQIAALLLHTNHTQAAHLYWLHTSDCTSGVTCSMHDDEFMRYLCFFFFFPKSVFPHLVHWHQSCSAVRWEKFRGVEDCLLRRWELSGRRTLLCTAWPLAGQRAGRVVLIHTDNSWCLASSLNIQLHAGNGE